MPEVNYRGIPMDGGAISTSSGTRFNRLTQQYENYSRNFQITENADGTLDLVPCNETLEHNGKHYAIMYVGQNRR